MENVSIMNILYYVFVFMFGCSFGSFYNVIIYRLPLNMSIAKGRSMCFSCKNQLHAIDLVPLLSYVFLRGKCRYCGAKIFPRYFVIEFTTGILFVLAYHLFSFPFGFLFMVLFWSMLLITAMIDLDEGYIYNSVLIIFTIPILLIKLLVFKNSIVNIIISGLAGFIIYFIIYFVSKKIYGREAFGMGDCYLMTAIGLILDMSLTIICAFMSFIVALIIIIILSLFGGKFKLSQELPFGPYMCITAFILSIFGQQLINIYIDFAFK